MQSLAAWPSAAAVPFLERRPAGAAEFEYKLSHDTTTNHPMHLRAVEAVGKIAADSGGRVDIRVFPNSALGGDVQTLSQLRLGALELLLSYDSITETVVPTAGLSSIPFAFAGHREAWRAMDGALGNYIRSEISKIGIYPLARSWDVGFRQVENSIRPVRTPGDLKGLKLRIPDTPVETSLFKALGVTPAQINGSEQYTALQTHLVDGTELPLITVQERKMYEVVKYVALTNHIYTGFTLLANGDAWQRLPKNLRDVCERRFNDAAVACRQDFVNLDASLEESLKGHGMSFTEPDLEAFKRTLSSNGFYGQWRNHYGPEGWGLLESAVGTLR